MILNSNKENAGKNKETKLVPEMLNLLGCNKEKFLKLLKLMNYKTFEKDKVIFFKYVPLKKKFKKNKDDIKYSDSPFRKLVQLNLK